MKVTNKGKIRKAIKDSLKDTYGKAGYTTTADRFYKLFCNKLKLI
jgi:hypothetical protein